MGMRQLCQSQHPHDTDLRIADYLLAKHRESARRWKRELGTRGSSWLVEHAIWHALQAADELAQLRADIEPDRTGVDATLARSLLHRMAAEFVEHDDFPAHWRRVVDHEFRARPPAFPVAEHP